MSDILNDAGLDLLFRDARTQNEWQDQEVSDVLLQAVFDLAKMGPTSANCSPMRLLFLRSKEAKEKLRPGPDRDQRGQDHGGPGDGDRRLRP